MSTLAFGLFTVGLSVLAIVAITCVWGLLDGHGARRDARRRNGAHRL